MFEVFNLFEASNCKSAFTICSHITPGPFANYSIVDFAFDAYFANHILANLSCSLYSVNIAFRRRGFLVREAANLSPCKCRYCLSDIFPSRYASPCPIRIDSFSVFYAPSVGALFRPSFLWA